jgi:hypothetical protein
MIRRRRGRFAAALAAALLFSLNLATVTSANPGAAPGSQGTGGQGRCTVGDAQALFQVLAVPYSVMKLRGQDHPGLLAAFDECQYRLFFDGESFTFCEADVIVGGVVLFWDYKAVGISRAAAIADLEQSVDRVWLNGQEQVLQRTGYKNVNSPDFGLIVYQQRAFIAQLAPGDYVSVYLSTYPGFPDFTATVQLHVLPRALCS